MTDFFSLLCSSDVAFCKFPPLFTPLHPFPATFAHFPSVFVDVSELELCSGRQLCCGVACATSVGRRGAGAIGGALLTGHFGRGVTIRMPPGYPHRRIARCKSSPTDAPQSCVCAQAAVRRRTDRVLCAHPHPRTGTHPPACSPTHRHAKSAGHCGPHRSQAALHLHHFQSSLDGPRHAAPLHPLPIAKRASLRRLVTPVVP